MRISKKRLAEEVGMSKDAISTWLSRAEFSSIQREKVNGSAWFVGVTPEHIALLREFKDRRKGFYERARKRAEDGKAVN